MTVTTNLFCWATVSSSTKEGMRGSFLALAMAAAVVTGAINFCGPLTVIGKSGGALYPVAPVGDDHRLPLQVA
jgi:hypothetical protein